TERAARVLRQRREDCPLLFDLRVRIVSRAQQLLQKCRWVWKYHALDTLVSRNLRELFRNFDRLIEPPKVINQTSIARLLARPHAALANRVDVFRIFAATLC